MYATEDIARFEVLIAVLLAIQIFCEVTLLVFPEVSKEPLHASSRSEFPKNPQPLRISKRRGTLPQPQSVTVRQNSCCFILLMHERYLLKQWCEGF